MQEERTRRKRLIRKGRPDRNDTNEWSRTTPRSLGSLHRRGRCIRAPVHHSAQHDTDETRMLAHRNRCHVAAGRSGAQRRLARRGWRTAFVCRAATAELLTRIKGSYNYLRAKTGVETQLELRTGGSLGLGLVTPEARAPGDVLMRVPRAACIVVDYNTGLSVPPGRWPRLRAGVSAEGDPLPWDILQALALIDGLAGDGDAFWEEYTDALLPAPEALCLPSCWEAHRLDQLQHPAIADAARAQQDRLRGLFPDLMEPLAPDTPSWLQWAFASVRSRAFRAGPDAFAFVPFLDLANHADQTSPASPSPNADFRVAQPQEAQNGTPSPPSASSCFELVAVRPLAAGEEVTISYCGAEGYTNQRWMAQYGFVPRGGNLADRVPLELTQELQAAPLDLSRLQDLLGDQLFLAALRGTDPYLYAAIKSLPLMDSTAAGSEAAGGRGADVRTAEALLSQVEQQVAQGSTPLEEDEALLHGQAGAELLAADPRQHAAVAYRVERKRLLAKTGALLRAYAKGAKAG